MKKFVFAVLVALALVACNDPVRNSGQSSSTQDTTAVDSAFRANASSSAELSSADTVSVQPAVSAPDSAK